MNKTDQVSQLVMNKMVDKTSSIIEDLSIILYSYYLFLLS